MQFRRGNKKQYYKINLFTKRINEKSFYRKCNQNAMRTKIFDVLETNIQKVPCLAMNML